MMNAKRKVLPAVSAILAASVSAQAQQPPAATAQSTTASTQAAASGDNRTQPVMLQEVVVTAQRRSENLQNVPIAVTALSADELAASGVQSTQELPTITPGLEVSPNQGFLLPHIRGVGSTSFGPGFENSVAIYVDGVYIEAGVGALLTLNNVDQIEVLKGPQGTLFGRNATGGLIQITTKAPQQTFSGEADVGYGNYQILTGGAYVTGPIVAEKLAADLAVTATTQGQGYGTNLFDGKDTYKTDRDIAVRSKWLWTPTDATTVQFIGDFENTGGPTDVLFQPARGTGVLFGPGTALGPPGSVAPNYRSPYDVYSSLQQDYSLKGGGASVRLDQDLGFAKFSSIGAYRRSTYGEAIDPLESGPYLLERALLQEVDTQYTEELQLTSNHSGPLQWVAGAFYLNGASALEPPAVINFGGPLSANPALPPGVLLSSVSVGGVQSTQSTAAYAQATWAFREGDHLTLGARYTWDVRKVHDGSEALNTSFGTLYPLNPINPFAPAPPFAQSKRFTAPTWRAAYDHRFNDEAMAYVSYNRGFKSGGFNLQGLGQSPYKEETLNAYETGLKLDLLDRRLRLDTAAYYYDYRNIQVPYFLNGAVAYYNGAKATIYGLDLDLKVRVSADLTLTAGASWIHDRYVDFPNAITDVPNPPFIGGNTETLQSAAGKRLPSTPDETFDLAADYTYPLARGSTLGLNVTYFWSNRFILGPSGLPYQPAYNLVNATASWTAPGQRFTVSLWGKNLTNETVLTTILSNPIVTDAAYQPPRTYGIRLDYKF